MKKTELTNKPNFLLIPVNQLKMNDTNMELYNNELKKCKGYNPIIRTLSGGISYRTRFPAYDVRNTTSCVELTVIDDTGMFRLQFRNSGEVKTEQALSGHKCFLKFRELCKKFNINLDNYIINNGEDVKKEIEKYIIKLERVSFRDKIFTAHHIDFHSSFASGLALTHPEFRPVIEELYNKRKENPEYKLILNSTIGYMQSIPCCSAKWANLSKDAINNNNQRLHKLAEDLINSDHMILAYNTDGIWYTGDVYHGEGEGKTVGTWENDHTNCQIRFKSAGSYEFIEDGQYNPVVRGHTRLDELKDRAEWKWGDIYKIEATPIKYVLLEDGSIGKIEEE